MQSLKIRLLQIATKVIRNLMDSLGTNCDKILLYDRYYKLRQNVSFIKFG